MNDLEWCLFHKVNRFLFLKNVAHCFRKMEIIKALFCYRKSILIIESKERNNFLILDSFWLP